MANIIETVELTKNYGNITAVDHINMHIEKGVVYGLIGKNGAGKTTALKMIAGLANPTEGQVTFPLGKPRIGTLIENPGLYPNMSALDNLEVRRIALGVGSRQDSERLLNFVGLSNWMNVKPSGFSLGMKQRLGIAMALTGDPDLLILDEPINGLDPGGIADVRKMIKSIVAEGNKTIIISSHILEELSKTASVFGVLNEGRLTAEITQEELSSSAVGYIKFMLDDVPLAIEVLEKMGIYSYQRKGDYLLHVLEQLDRASDMVREFVMNGITVSSMEVVHESLEDFYIGNTRGSES